MAKTSNPNPVLLRWSKHTPTSKVQDPLGTSLRGSARLASQLLHCITSITSRARYFTFIPWCVYDYKLREQNPAADLRKAISLREQALTLGCVSNHDGKACQGGALVGSRNAIKWFESHRSGEADFRRISFVKNPALDAYYNSLVNLGVFVTDEQLPDTDEATEHTFDDIELSALGSELASRYDSCVGRLKAVKQIASSERQCSVKSLKTWGSRGGLCELADPLAPDRSLLRDIFFCRMPMQGESHPVRRRSLLLILELCRQLNEAGCVFNHSAFSDAVYYGELATEDEKVSVHVPSALDDIATRWRMFYFHYYMSVAFEGLFSGLVSRLVDAELQGEVLASVVSSIYEENVVGEIAELFGISTDAFSGQSSPAALFATLGVPLSRLDAQVSKRIDSTVRINSGLAEPLLEFLIRRPQFRHRSTGLAVSLILLVTTIARYRQWEGTKYGNWFISAAAYDRHLDLIPPLVSTYLASRFGDWWNCSWREIAAFVLSRFIVQQHRDMSYEKSASGDSCLLQVHETHICTTGSYDKIGVGNPRFGSAVQILKDLGLLEQTEDDDMFITPEGEIFLTAELAQEPVR
jgi:hypothetical protein